MATNQSFIDFLVDNMQLAGDVIAKKMFGEYAIYVDGKVVALVCDNNLFVKQTEACRTFIGACVEVPPYPGALIDDKLEDRDWLSHLALITARELPEPKPKIKKK